MTAAPFCVDGRGCVTLALFLLAAAELGLLAWHPDLENNKLFFAVMSATFSGGVLLAANYYLGSSKDSSAKTATIADMAVAAATKDDA